MQAIDKINVATFVLGKFAHSSINVYFNLIFKNHHHHLIHQKIRILLEYSIFLHI
jgi:hypothetical protein